MEEAMTKALTLTLPDSLYDPLLRMADRAGQSPEQIVSEWTEKILRQLTNEDPLLQLAGIFESDLTDISRNHDSYIGQNLSNNE
jgi:hypothetical protein